MTTLHKVLISIDRSPFDAMNRALLGFVCIPLLSFLSFDVSSTWVLTMGLLLLMLGLRVVPAVMRRLMALPHEVKAVWDERRNIAKRYDSFQWQKLFFIGIGLIGYMLVSGQALRSAITVSSFCLACGAVGLFRWYTQIAEVRRSVVNKGAL